MFLTQHSRQGGMINLAHIVSAQKVEKGWIVTDSQGEEHGVDNFDMALALQLTPLTSFAATPGTYIISPREGHEIEKVWRTAVLGWMVCADGETRPICADPEATVGKIISFLMPDGRVENDKGQLWDSLETWLSDPPE